MLALKSKLEGVEVEQLYCSDLSEYLTQNIRLIYSGESRKSGINNWEVYKGFFDGDENIKNGLSEISQLSHKAYSAIKRKSFDELLSFIAKEGAIRESLFPLILTKKMKKFQEELFKTHPRAGMKVCGAGGGGCFVVTNANSPKLNELLDRFDMTELVFDISLPEKMD